MKTKRLTLTTFTAEMMEASLHSPGQLEQLSKCRVPEGYPMEVYKEMLPYKIERFRKFPEENQWEGIIINTDEQTILGDMGFKGGPDENGDMDIGYSILPGFQDRGYATEMAAAMIEWGLKQPGVKRITASCSEENKPSIRVLEKSGFTPTGVEDGEVYWEIKP
ncbi:GNAT family N-acetyltransferase [Halobacillus litoralis]|uniref:GNAT family N-acetyltransferase n=1 Tax=Halobacillus litoralis TaxID=45668 RepID=UPI001CFCB335|nr:GNAT family N-acetyltransferase [Halobacillus litoralis]